MWNSKIPISNSSFIDCMNEDLGRRTIEVLFQEEE